jgi:rhamnose utilization protein RhaD (predicted bifunctional aldolase and dehydrogenase)
MVEIKELRRFSARIGSDPLLVQAAGGNTSIKIDGTMWIKASGTWLRDAAARDILVPVDHAALMAGLEAGDPDCETCLKFVRADLNRTGLRPSIETTVHALMPQKVVAHVHCVNTIAWAIQKDAKRLLEDKLAGFNWAFVPYARPGLPLASAISQAIRSGTDVLILGNHGLAVAANSVSEAEWLLDSVVSRLVRPARPALPHQIAREHPDYRVPADPEAHTLATDPVALAAGHEGVFYPDHVVFLGVGVAREFGAAPAVAIPGEGVMIRKDAKPAVEPMVRCLADVMRRIEPGDGLVRLTDDQIAELTNWDAEKYRQTLKA